MPIDFSRVIPFDLSKDIDVQARAVARKLHRKSFICSGIACATVVAAPVGVIALIATYIHYRIHLAQARRQFTDMKVRALERYADGPATIFKDSEVQIGPLPLGPERSKRYRAAMAQAYIPATPVVAKPTARPVSETFSEISIPTTFAVTPVANVPPPPPLPAVGPTRASAVKTRATVTDITAAADQTGSALDALESLLQNEIAKRGAADAARVNAKKTFTPTVNSLGQVAPPPPPRAGVAKTSPGH